MLSTTLIERILIRYNEARIMSEQIGMSKINLKMKWWAFFLWTCWVFFYAIVMYFQVTEIPFVIALISSATFNYIFGLLSIFVWLICRKIPYGQIHPVVFFLSHFTLSGLFTAFWLVLAYGLWYLNVGDVMLEQVDIRGIIGWQFIFGMMQYFLVVGIFYTIFYYQNFKRKEINEAELKILARDAELKALKLQMNPHFLFNTLNSINALITQNPGLARKMISQLSELLRASLESHDKLMISLKEELDLVHLYIAIERIRFGEKMQFEERIDPELLTAPFPAMLLQPLLENAVKHGIANSRRGGRIELSIQKSNDYLLGTVSNEIDDRINRETSNGISLKNIQQRLDRMYGDKYTWSTSPNDSSYFTVSFKFPIG